MKGWFKLAKDPVSTIALTPEQARFLAGFLGILPKKKDLRAAAFAQNETIKKAFLRYEKIRAEVFGSIDHVADALAAAQVRHALYIEDAGQADAAFQAALDDVKADLDGLRIKANGQVRIATSAPPESPKFADCADVLDVILPDVQALMTLVPKPPQPGAPGTGRIIADLARIDALKRFEDVAQFTFSTAQTALSDAAKDTKRTTLLATHDGLCDAARVDVDKILKKATAAKATPAIVARACDDATARLRKLEKDRGATIRSLSILLNEPAAEAMAALAAKGNKLAEREVKRTAELKAARKQMLTAAGAIKAQMDDASARLKAKPDASQGEEPMGFDQRQALQAEFAMLEARRAEILDLARQMRIYRDSTGERLAAIEQATRDLEFARKLLEGDPKKALKALAQAQGLKDVPPAPHTDRPLLVGETNEDGAFINGRYQNLKEKFTRSRERVSVDARLFPDEPDLTDITEEQYVLLCRMLDKAVGLLNGDRTGEAAFLMNEADKLWLKFVGANKFALPDLAETPTGPRARVEAAIKDVTVLLDRFWGIGGDGDGKLRTELKRISAGVAQKGKGAMPLVEAEKALGVLEADILAAQAAFQPAATDTAARAKAAETQNKLSAELTKLYKTKVVAETDIARIPRDMLITVKGKDGSVTYYEIESERGGTQEKVDDKKIPRETMAQLFAEANALELMAQSTTPDCAAAIDAAVARAEILLKNAQDGGPDYKYVADQIKVVNGLVPKDGSLWVPAGLVDRQIAYADFKKTYPTRMTAVEARIAIDGYKTAFEQLQKDAATLEKRHKAVGEKLDKLEKDLSDGRGAAKGNPAEVLKKMVKDGPEKLLREVISGPLDAAGRQKWDSLVADIKGAIAGLKDAGKDGKSLEGDFTNRIRTARQSLDTRSDAGISRADAAADLIRKDMNKLLGELAPANAGAGMPYLEKLAAFLTDARKGADRAKTLRNDITTIRSEIRKALDDAKAVLEGHGDSLRSFNEYMNVLQGITQQYESTKKNFEKSDDAEWALSQFKLHKSSAVELLAEVSNLTVTSTKETIGVDMKAWQTALENNIEKVASAAEAAAAAMVARAQEDEVQKADASLQAAVTKAAAALRKATPAYVKALVKLKSEVLKAVSDAMAQTDEARRLASLATARETALADVRRIRTVTEADPVLKLYRENPFDEGMAWAQYLVTLHGLEVKILTQLRPR